MKLILVLASPLFFISQIFANYDPSLNYNEPDYDEPTYDDRGDYDNNDSYAEDPAYEYQDPANVTIDMKDFDIPKKDCFIKGNISDTGEKIYHIPGCDYYKETLISKEGEKYFCSEYEAYKAGFRKAINCPSTINYSQDTYITVPQPGAMAISTYSYSTTNSKKIEIILVCLIALGLSRSLRLFSWNLFANIFRFPVILFSRIFAYLVYVVGMSKYDKYEPEVRMRFLQIWVTKLEKDGSSGFFRKLYTPYLLENLRAKVK